MKKQVFARNKKARFDFHILEEYEAGIVLTWPEVKSIRNNRVNLKGSFVVVTQHLEAHATGIHISEYSSAQNHAYEPKRDRKLLLHKKQILALSQKMYWSSMTLVPLEIYAHHGLIKLSIGLAQGKKKYDKREVLKKRDLARDTEINFRLKM